MTNQSNLRSTVAAALLAVVFSSTFVLSAVGPARAADGGAAVRAITA